MKKTLFAISAIAVLLGFTACTSENEILEPQVSGKTITIKAYTEETTRTSLSGTDAAGYNVVWETGDEIKIGENTFTLTNGAGTTSGTFTGDALTDGTEYTAYYPADYDGETWPTTQTYTAGNITGSPMKATFTYSESEEPSLSFKNEGGILRLTLKLEAESSDARSVKKIVVSSSQLADDIVLNCETAVALTEEGVPFHIAVPAKAYTDLKFTIYDAEGSKCTKSLSSGKTLTVVRSQITPVNLTASNFKVPNYLCFTATETLRVTLNKVNSPAEVTLQTSSDGTSWKDYNIGEEISLNDGEKVYFRSKSAEVTQFSDEDNYYQFSMTGSIAASGNVMSLIDPTCATTTIPCEGCFYYLFYNCTDLTTAPELPATTLAANCYQNMFYGCKNLTSAPALPAEALAEGCYDNMFNSCLKLSSVTCLATNISASNCVSNWLGRTSKTGTFYCAPGMAGSWTGKVNGWTIEEK